ncbi:unnamed protein product, partial [Polarella glacialis]
PAIKSSSFSSLATLASDLSPRWPVAGFSEAEVEKQVLKLKKLQRHMVINGASIFLPESPAKRKSRDPWDAKRVLKNPPQMQDWISKTLSAVPGEVRIDYQALALILGPDKSRVDEDPKVKRRIKHKEGDRK